MAKGNTATLSKILEYIDRPHVVLLDRGGDRKIIAVAIDDEQYKYGFFGAEISNEQWYTYRRGFHDLRFLFLFPRWKSWCKFDLATAENSKVVLQWAPKDQLAEREYIPEPGFFAWDHSEPVAQEEAEGRATLSYKTDGVWQLPDFSHLYSKITDLYAFFLSLKDYSASSTSVEKKKKIKDAFEDPPLRGGSSYINLYGDLSSIQTFEDELTIKKLQYASAGEVIVQGRGDVFGEISTTFARFSSDYERLKEKYNSIHRYLGKGGYLKKTAEHFENVGAVADHLRRQSNELAIDMGLSDTATLYELTGSNALNYSKVVLSHFRRLEKYFMFFAEGRVVNVEEVTGVKRRV
jgi:hypothetical protein